ncbi:hypothetical protein HPB52_010081 [Rhipicephalus sanguineus]|uniref:Uncharacterized protein n=1 Tax=Rhipicephalus sanguineus TaxID=34632 RepID=A0A9D4SU46_RHISA|nr:hypothetical protein HPB52_010081 [Rhipicephalus sanguineus]
MASAALSMSDDDGSEQHDPGELASEDDMARPQCETLGTYRALRHFDEFYAGVFGDAWPSVRLALLCPNKPCALPNTLAPNVEDVEKQLHSLGALSLRNLCERRVAVAASTRDDDAEPATSLELAMPHEHADTTSGDKSFDEGSRYMPANDASAPLMSFVPSSRLVYQEEQMSEDSYHGFYKPDADIRLPIKHWPVGKGTIFPGKLDVALFATGDISTFPRPCRSGKERLLGPAGRLCMWGLSGADFKDLFPSLPEELGGLMLP